MVQKIKYDNEKEVEVSILPKLKPFSNISLSQGDTVVAFVDKKDYDVDEAQSIYQMLRKTFPDNNILILSKGIDIGVIKHE